MSVQDRVRFRRTHRVRYSADNAFRFRSLFHRAIRQIVRDTRIRDSSSHREDLVFTREAKTRGSVSLSQLNRRTIKRRRISEGEGKIFLTSECDIREKARLRRSRSAPQSSCDRPTRVEKGHRKSHANKNRGQQWSRGMAGVICV